MCVRNVLFLCVGCVAAMCAACTTVTSPTITLASGAVTVMPPHAVTVLAPAAASLPIPAATAVKLLNVQSNQLLNQLRSPCVSNISDAIKQSESQNELYQAAAIIIATAAPFTTGLHFAQRALISIVGGFVTYKSTKGSPVVQNEECHALNSELAEIQQFDAKWTLTFTADGEVSQKDFSSMLEDAKTVSANVSKVVNGCMNASWS